MDILKFTPEYKNEILKKLCSECSFYRMCSVELGAFYREDREMLEVCLQQFKQRGFIQEFVLSNPYTSVVITADAADFLRRGGFVFEETYLLQQIDKAILELNQLQSQTKSEKHIEQIGRVAGILANLVTTLRAI